VEALTTEMSRHPVGSQL